MDIILFLTTIVPPLLFLCITYWLDGKEKEPKGLILLLFALGGMSTLPIAIAEGIGMAFNFFPADSVIYAFVDNFFNIAVCEELGKFLCMFSITWNCKHFNHKYDAIVYAVAVSIGFATIENILYVLEYQSLDGSGMSVAISRMIFSIPAHLVFAICMGLFYGPMKKAANHKQNILMVVFCVLSLFVPMFLHGLYDFCLSVDSILLTLLFIVLVVIMDIGGIIISVVSSLTDQKITISEPDIDASSIVTNIMSAKAAKN